MDAPLPLRHDAKTCEKASSSSGRTLGRNASNPAEPELMVQASSRVLDADSLVSGTALL